MPKMRELTVVDADYAITGPNHHTLRQTIPVPATTLFNCLADGAAWKEWLGVDVEWTTPEPRGVGTTRTVTTGGQTIEEYFFTWDEGERMAFRFDRCTLPVRAFAEHYECVPTGDTTCELEWSYAFEWGGPLTPVFGRAFGAGFAFNAKRALKKLAKLLEDDPRRFA
jgi:hypothetical protein